MSTQENVQIVKDFFAASGAERSVTHRSANWSLVHGSNFERIPSVTSAGFVRETRRGRERRGRPAACWPEQHPRCSRRM